MGTKRHGRKLLVATIGVATVYMGCNGGPFGQTSGNLVAPPPCGQPNGYCPPEAGPDANEAGSPESGAPDASDANLDAAG